MTRQSKVLHADTTSASGAEIRFLYLMHEQRASVHACMGVMNVRSVFADPIGCIQMMHPVIGGKIHQAGRPSQPFSLAAALAAASSAAALASSPAHMLQFSRRLSSMSEAAGKVSAKALYIGMATMLKKPVWLLVTPPLARSMSGEMGCPSARSWSPCRNISSSSCATHRLCTSGLLVKWPRSAHLREICEGCGEACSEV